MRQNWRREPWRRVYRLAGTWKHRSQSHYREANSNQTSCWWGAARDYVDESPGAADLALVIEISDSTLARDQGFKKAIYAKSGIPVYWIVNLVDRRVEVYSDPGGDADKPDFRQRHDYGEVHDVPLVIGGQEMARIPVRALLP